LNCLIFEWFSHIGTCSIYLCFCDEKIQRSWIDTNNSTRLSSTSSRSDGNVLEERSQWTSCILSFHFILSTEINHSLATAFIIILTKWVFWYFLWSEWLKEYWNNLLNVELSRFVILHWLLIFNLFDVWEEYSLFVQFTCHIREINWFNQGKLFCCHYLLNGYSKCNKFLTIRFEVNGLNWKL
jgi:hypothetical protein